MRIGSRAAVSVAAAALALAVLVSACLPADPADSTPSVPAADPRDAPFARARELSEGLSLEAACGQLIMTGIGGRGVLDQPSRLLLSDLPAGAVMLFGFNIPPEAGDLRPSLDLAQEIARGSGAGIPLFVAVDHEGGEVFRFRDGVTRLPSARALGDAGSEAVAGAGATAGRELRALGISLNLAPVAEAWDARNGGFLGTRSFSADPAEAGSLAAAFLTALQAEGIAAAAKHYPGNGSEDPHKAVPVVEASPEEIASFYDPPFRRVIEAGAAAVMLSHAMFPALDPDSPASLSPAVIGRLKGELGFRGIVLTDDVAMKALSGSGGAGASAVAAVKAGADMVMASGGRIAREAYGALLDAVRSGELPEARVRDAAARILAQKIRFGLIDGLDRTDSELGRGQDKQD